MNQTAKSSSDKEGVSEDAVNYRDVEYLDVNSASDLHSDTPSDRQPSFEDLSDGPSSENVTKNPLFLHGLNVPQQDSADSNLFEKSLHRGDAPTELNITVNLSAKEFKQFAFHFIGVFYVRFFKTQRLADPVQTSDIFGNTVEELLKCMWQKSCPYVSREVVVNYTEEANSVAWSTKENPDFSDVNKFIVLRHQKTKKLYSVEDLRDGLKVLTSWRGKSIQVHIYKYSTSLKSNTIWELTNKSLLQPGNKDRAGARTTEELFDCISELKEVHCHYTALYSSWEKRANFILSQPGDRQSRLKHEAPPDEYLHLFRAPPISEGNQLQVTPQYGGLA